MLKLYENIKKLRLELGMTQTELAKRTGYNDKSMISRIEKGLVDLPQSKIVAFAKALGVRPGELMGWTDEPAPYYFNAETAQIAEAIFQNPDLRLLFDAGRNATPDDLRTARDVLSALKRKEGGNNE